MRKTILYILLLALYSNIASQGYTTKNYSVEHGLPFIQVRGTEQDNNGYIYVFGYGSIGKFDGKRFYNFGQENGILEYNILSLTINPRTDDVWVGTANGIYKIMGNTLYNFKSNSNIKNQRVHCMAWDTENTLWIGTENGLFKKDTNDNFTKVKGFENDTVNQIYINSAQQFWISTNSELIQFKNNQIIKKTKTLELGINGVITDLLEFQNTLFIATNEGLFHLTDQNKAQFIGIPDERSRVINHLCAYNSKLLMATETGLFALEGKLIKKINFSNLNNANIIKDICIDYEKNIWLSTDNGLYKLRPSAFERVKIEENNTATYVFQTIRDKQNNLWFGTQYNGPNYLDKNNKLYNFNTLYKKSIKVNQSLLSDDDDNIWINADGSLIIKLKNGTLKIFENFPLKRVANFYKDKNGNVYVCGISGIVSFKKNDFNNYTFTTLTNPKNNRIHSLYEFNSDYLIACTSKSGLLLYDIKNKTFKSIQTKIKSENIFNIVKDKQNYFYCSTLEGVQILNNKLEFIDRITQANGLSSNMVYAVQTTENNLLLVGSNQGLGVVNTSQYYQNNTFIIKNYGKEEGFEGVECNTNCFLKDLNNNYLISTINGLYRYSPEKEIPNTYESKLRITNIKLFYKDTNLTEGAKLRYNENNLIFYYRGICLTNPERVTYTYKLEGLDKNWTPITKDNFATYPNLPSGDYVFKVKATNNEGKWNKEAVSFKFTIRSPFWQTGWFYLLGISSLGALLYIYFKMKLAQVRKIEKDNFNKQLDITKYELKALRAQMNPHFIFNSLNSIQHFIVKNNDGQAIKYLTKFARLIRMILDNSESATITINEEVEAIKIYVELEMMRFENKFSFQLIIDPSIDADLEEIPSMLIQPYIENAILHGLTIKEDHKGILKLHIMKENVDGSDLIVCTIEDNGIGRALSVANKTLSGKMHRSLGMKVTAERLNLLNDLNKSSMSVNISDLKEENGQAAGTKVEIYIPIIR